MRSELKNGGTGLAARRVGSEAARATPVAAASERVDVGLTRADADRVAEVGHEDLAVADLASFGRRGDRLDHAVDAIRRDRHLDLHLGQEIHGVFGAAIDLGVSLLASVALDFADGQTADAETTERLAHVVKLERLDDRNDQFHAAPPPPLATIFGPVCAGQAARESDVCPRISQL